jgi:hypothetical protein
VIENPFASRANAKRNFRKELAETGITDAGYKL